MSWEFKSLIKIASPTLKIKYVPLPSKFEVEAKLVELEAPNDPTLLALRLLLPPLPPTKLSARLPFPPPSNRAAAIRTPLPELKLDCEAVGVDGEGLSLR